MTATRTLTSDPLEIMIASDTWATGLLLDLCARLSHEQFHQPFEIGLGSLHDNLVHVVGVIRRWTDRLSGRPLRPVLKRLPQFPNLGGEDRDYSIDDLRALLEAAAADLRTVMNAHRHALSETVTVEWPARSGGNNRYTFTRGAVLVHICTHGAHHRAQCMNMLRHLNVPSLSDQLPEPSVVDWQGSVESPPLHIP